jgi:hypothetical protein
MSARQDYAKKLRTPPKRSKKKAKASRGNVTLRLVLLTLIVTSIAAAYYMRRDLFQIQTPQVIAPIVNITEKPHFEFYSKLPEAKKEIVKNEVKKGPYQIQVAKVDKAKEADSLKAELTLDGYSVATKSTKSNDGKTSIQVNVGPYPTLAEAKQAADILKANSYDGEISAVG